MGNKLYTPDEFRAAILKLKSFQGNRLIAIRIEDMLRQAADAIELITKLRQEIEGMETAPLDGVPEHMNINAKVTLAKLEFYQKVSALGEFPKCEEEQKKTVEFKRAGRTYTTDDMRKVASGKMSSSVSLTFDERDVANMLLKGADAIEREARRKMKYEYIERYKNGCLSGSVSRTLAVARACMSPFSTILRREVGEWEEVKE